MSTDQAINLVYAVGFVLTAIGTILNWISNRANGAAIQQVHLLTNSLKDELVEATRVGAYAQGRKDQSEGNGGGENEKIDIIGPSTGD